MNENPFEVFKIDAPYCEDSPNPQYTIGEINGELLHAEHAKDEASRKFLSHGGACYPCVGMPALRLNIRLPIFLHDSGTHAHPHLNGSDSSNSDNTTNILNDDGSGGDSGSGDGSGSDGNFNDNRNGNTNGNRGGTIWMVWNEILRLWGALLSLLVRIVQLLSLLFAPLQMLVHAPLDRQQELMMLANSSTKSQSLVRAVAWHPRWMICAVALSDHTVHMYHLVEELWSRQVLRHDFQRTGILDMQWRPICSSSSRDSQTLAVVTKYGVCLWEINKRISMAAVVTTQQHGTQGVQQQQGTLVQQQNILVQHSQQQQQNTLFQQHSQQQDTKKPPVTLFEELEMDPAKELLSSSVKQERVLWGKRIPSPARTVPLPTPPPILGVSGNRVAPAGHFSERNGVCTFLRVHNFDELSSLAWSPSGDTLVVASLRDHRILVWRQVDNNSTGSNWSYRMLTRFNGGVTHVGFSPNGRYLASFTMTGVFRVWDTRNWSCEKWNIENARDQSHIPTATHPLVQCFQWSSNSQYLLFSLHGHNMIHVVHVEEESKMAQACYVEGINFHEYTFEDENRKYAKFLLPFSHILFTGSNCAEQLNSLCFMVSALLSYLTRAPM